MSYVVNSLSLDSMLRCLIHILVSAEPISLVAPGTIRKQTFIFKKKKNQNKVHFKALTKLNNKM